MILLYQSQVIGKLLGFLLDRQSDVEQPKQLWPEGFLWHLPGLKVREISKNELELQKRYKKLIYKTRAERSDQERCKGKSLFIHSAGRTQT